MLRLINDRILIKPDENEYFDPEVARILKEGTLIAPDISEGTLKKVAAKGKIVSFGSKCKYDYKEGETVYYSRFAGESHWIGDEKYLFIMEQDIHAIEEHTIEEND